MTFSVVVVIFRQGEVVESFFQSLLDQDYPKSQFEIVFVKSGSGLGPEAFAAAAQKSQVNFTYLSPGQGNVGPARGRNLGVAAVSRGQTKIKSEVVAFTDDDCRVPPDWLKSLAQVWQKNPGAAGAGGVSLPSLEKVRQNLFAKHDEALYGQYFPNPRIDLGLLRQGELKSFLSRKVLEHPVFSGNLAYLRSVFEAVGGFDEGYGPGVYGEDAALKEKVLARGHFLVFVSIVNEHLSPYDFWSFKKQQEGRGRGIVKFRAGHHLTPQSAAAIYLRLLLSFLTFPVYLLKTRLSFRLSLLETLGYFFRQWGKLQYLRKNRNESAAVQAKTSENKKMRILFLDHTPLLGGAQLALWRHLKYLDRQKFEPAVVVSPGGSLLARFQGLSDLIVFPASFPKLKVWNFWLFFSMPLAAFKILKLTERFKPELLVANTERAFYLSLPAALFWKKRLILVVRDFEYARIFLSLTRFKVESYLCVSQKIADFYKFPPDKVKIIYVGSDLTLSLKKVTPRKVEALKTHLGLKRGTLVIGFVGRLIEWKGPELALESFDHLRRERPDPPLHLIIVGGGALRWKLKEEVLRLGLSSRVSLVGEVTKVELWYKIFDLFLHASTGPEPFATTIIEAALAELPIVATKTGGTEEFIDDGENGLLVKPDVAAIVVGLQKLIFDLELREKLGQKALAKASKDFTEEIVTRKMEEVYLGGLN